MDLSLSSHAPSHDGSGNTAGTDKTAWQASENKPQPKGLYLSTSSSVNSGYEDYYEEKDFENSALFTRRKFNHATMSGAECMLPTQRAIMDIISAQLPRVTNYQCLSVDKKGRAKASRLHKAPAAGSSSRSSPSQSGRQNASLGNLRANVLRAPAGTDGTFALVYKVSEISDSSHSGVQESARNFFLRFSTMSSSEEGPNLWQGQGSEAAAPSAQVSSGGEEQPSLDESWLDLVDPAQAA